MIEITCPSCGARYQVPDDSIGPNGRNVSCSNCSHKWRAYGPGGSPAGEESVADAATEASDAATEASDIAGTGTDAPVGSETSTDAPGDPARQEQMEAIRRMLEELKSSSEDIPPPEPEERLPVSEGPSPTVRRRDEDDEEDDLDTVDPLRARIAQMSRRGGGPVEKVTDYDAEKLRKRHEKRVKRLQRARERRKGSGAFLTGLTLVGTVAAVMTGLYVLKPQIVARSPEMAPALEEYVVTVDRFRVELDEATVGLRAWLEERIGRFTEKGEGGTAEGASRQQS